MNTDAIQFLRLPQVLAMISLGRSAWLQAVQDGSAPKPRKIGRASVWNQSEVQAWMRGKMPAAKGANSAAPGRLLKTHDRIDTNALEDTIYACALNVEDALLLGGAKPGADYSILDLYKLALPVAAAIFHENAAASFRAG